MQEQKFERNADFDQAQESSGDQQYEDNDDHSLQEGSADHRDHDALLTSRRLLHAKYGFTTQNNAFYDNHLHRTDEDQENANHLPQQESAAADHYEGKRGTKNVEVILRTKYGFSNHGLTSHSDHHLDRYGKHNRYDHHPDEQEAAAAEHGLKTASATLKANKSHRAYNSQPRPHDKLYVEHSTVNHQSRQHDFKGNHKGSGITSSTLQAAQAQAAELRALHSAMLNNYGFVDRNTEAYDKYHGKQRQEGALFHEARPKKACSKKGRKVYSDDEDEAIAQNPLSCASSSSSSADCAIRTPREYPVFKPSREDMNSLNHRSSVDSSEALRREERLNYIFDHENKRSFSEMQYNDLSKRELHNVSCFHESLNLRPRSSSSLTYLRDKDDHPLHHKSLDLPQVLQHHPFTHNLHPSKDKAFHRPISANDGSPFTLPAKTIHDGDLRRAALSTSMDQCAYEFNKPAFTGRQRALLEFLSEEPARMRAFNELSVTPDGAESKVQVRAHSSRNNAPCLGAEGHMSTSRRTKSRYECDHNDDHLQVGSSNHQPRQQSMPHSISHPAASRTNAIHPDRLNQNMNTGISFDKCRPLAGVHTVVPLSDSEDLNADYMLSNMAAAVPKERSDQKKPSFKGWFFRGKKKNNNADLLNNQAKVMAPTTIFTTKDRTPITSAASSTITEQRVSPKATTKEKQSSASTTSTTAATSSHVFSSLINLEAEKELEVAMAMDLMELKVLQANTKRDAAMAEVLELRLAMDTMAQKLVEAERSCEELRIQLINVQALHHQDSFEILVDDPDHAPAADSISTADQSNVRDSQVAENIMPHDADKSDDYQSDSIDHREERRPSKGISTIKTGLTSGYGSRNNIRVVQPTKADFLSAVADARVGIRQVSRVLLQHIQEKQSGEELPQLAPANSNAGLGKEEDEATGGLGKKGRVKENWGPILIICREAAKANHKARTGGGMSNSRRGRGVAYCVEAVISMAFHEHFENVGFDENGAHKILDPAQRALAFYHSFLKMAKLTPTQLLSQPSPLYNSAFDHFCSRKMRAIGRAVGCPGRLWPDELARSFVSAAQAVWLLHLLAFAYHGHAPGIFRVAAQSSLDPRFMEVLPSDSHHVAPSSHLCVSLLVMPGFFLPDDIIKCKVLASQGASV